MTHFRLGLLLLLATSALYVHLRGRDRFGLLKAMTDYTVLLAPYNALMYLFSRVKARPYVDVGHFPDLAPLQAHWQEIREEALRLDEHGRIRAATGYNDLGFNSFFRSGWKRFYLKWYGETPPSALESCPRTVALLQSIPSIKGAMFAALPPGGKLVRHRDPYAGSLRYHLGLVTPNNDTCQIVVDGQPYHWKDGEPVMFDETFIHTAENKSDVTRLILFCDVERPLHGRVMRLVNHWVKSTVIRASQTENMPGDHVGVLNHLFNGAYRVRRIGKWIKKKSVVAHYTLKWLLIGGALYLIFR